jgi:hypothetical protein
MKTLSIKQYLINWGYHINDKEWDFSKAYRDEKMYRAKLWLTDKYIDDMEALSMSLDDIKLLISKYQ